MGSGSPKSHAAEQSWAIHASIVRATLAIIAAAPFAVGVRGGKVETSVDERTDTTETFLCGCQRTNRPSTLATIKTASTPASTKNMRSRN